MTIEESVVNRGDDRRIAYRPALDGLRAVAILMVVAFHDRHLQGGFLGVDVFFALSGYLITSLLLEEHALQGSIHLGRFYARRALRLYPALTVFVGSTFVFTHFVDPDLSDRLEPRWALWALVYVTNLVSAYMHEYPLGTVSICWSLGLEEQFYVVWPLTLCLLLTLRQSKAAVLGVLLLGVVAPALVREWLVGRNPADPHLWMRTYFAPDTRADALLIGCLCAVLLAWWPGLFGARRFLSTAVLLSLAALGVLASTQKMLDFVRRPVLFTASALICAAIVVGAVRLAWLGRVLQLPPLPWIGRLSYSLYLWHEIGLHLGSAWGAAGRYGATLALAAGSHYLVERPFLKLKARLHPERS